MAANADIIMTISDDGTDLTMTAIGTYDNTGLVDLSDVQLGVNAMIGTAQCCHGWDTGLPSLAYFANYSGSLTGTASTFPTPANVVATTNPFWFWHNSDRIVFQTGSPLIGSVNESATWNGLTLSSLGMVAGESVAVTWGNNKGTIQTSASTPTIPEPSTMILFGSGLAGLIGWRWKSRKTA